MGHPYPPASVAAIGVTLPLLAVFVIALRFWVRLRLHPSKLGPDDWLILGAGIFCLGDGANIVVPAIIGNIGRWYETAAEVPEQRKIAEAKCDYAQVILEKPLYGLMKLSVLFFYRRIFFSQARFNIFNKIMIVVVILWTVVFLFADSFACGIHPEAQWTKGMSEDEYCVNVTWLLFCYSITDVITDICVVAMPYPYIRRLQLGKREKAGVTLIFMLGLLSTAASVIRLGFISKAFTDDYAGGAGPVKLRGTPPGVWSVVEADVGVIAACLPPMGPLLRRTPGPRKLSASIKETLITMTTYGRRKSSRRDGDLDLERSSTEPETPKACARDHEKAANDMYFDKMFRHIDFTSAR